MFGPSPFQSIAARLFISATLWIASILILAGIGLTALDRRLSEAAFDERLGVYIKALVAEGLGGGEENKGNAWAVVMNNDSCGRTGNAAKVDLME